MRSRRKLLLFALVVLIVGGPLLGPATPAPGTSPPRELAGPEGRFATLADIDVHHQVAGPEGAPAVLLLHHFYGSVATWGHVLTDLADEHRVAAFDRPAFGLTERPPRSAWNGTNPYTRETSARIAVELLDHLDVDQAVFIGSSAGGTSALEAYARAPERVRALVLVSPAITGDIGPPAFLRPVVRTPPLRRLGPRIVRRVAGDIDRARVSGTWHDPSRVTDEDVDAYARPLRADGWDVGFWELFGAEPPPDLRDLLPTIDMPTLVVSGASDTVISPRSNRRTAAAIPGAEYVELPGCGHMSRVRRSARTRSTRR